ncbi:MAG TPA: hypothetical protein VNK24_08990 [Elusimicrobiota bacterium]|nr:hypothetical protein [Elusimicrobiota bacterium]
MNVPHEKIADLAAKLGVDADFLERCLEEEIVIEANWIEEGDLPSAAATRMRSLQRICRALDIDEFSASLILELRERLEIMERELDFLRTYRHPS